MTPEEYRERALLEFSRDRWLCHATLFSHRHPDESAPAHRELVAAIHGPEARVSIEGFRGFAKSTYLEEAAVIKAAFREFHNMVILGASFGRAVERLEAIKREIIYNEELSAIFGPLKGPIWQEGKIVLANGICLQAIGRDQSMLGTKYLDWRPDAAFIDDLEDPNEIRTDPERHATWRWFLTTFLPALDDPMGTWARATGTRRGVGSLPQRLEEEAGWRSRKFPIEHIDAAGGRCATWPAKFWLAKIDAMKHTYRADMHTWMQEYMCQATSEADRVFTREMFRVEPVARTWQAVYAMIDPARTTNRQSATTGWAVWSWIRTGASTRLVVWAAGAEMLKPDEIIDLCFVIAEQYNPVWIGVEEDGLNEFILQPLRHEQARRGVTIPVKALRAPRGKLDFIRGLQPFFSAREVIFASAIPELEAQLLSFPTSKIDAPNALAYALSMRPAAPVYDSFTPESVAVDLEPAVARPLYLAANATRSLVTAALVQYIDGQLSILADWVVEGDSANAVAAIHAEAGLAADTTAERFRSHRPRDWTEALKLPVERRETSRQPIRWIVPPHHADRWNNVGLTQAIGLIPTQATRGAEGLAGQNQLRDMLGRLSRGAPAVQVSERSRWVLRGFTGGYCRAVGRGGGVADHAEDGPYRILMEGLESFVGMMARAQPEEDDSADNVSYDKRGRSYKSAMPAR